MRLSRLLLLALVLFITTACNTSKIYTAHIKADKVYGINYTTPISYITSIEKGNVQNMSDSASHLSDQLLLESFRKNEQYLRLHKHIEI